MALRRACSRFLRQALPGVSCIEAAASKSETCQQPFQHQHTRGAKKAPSFPYEPPEFPTISIARKHGYDVLHDPALNKGTAFTMAERERLKLRGLLPPRVLDMELQLARLKDDYWEGADYINPEDVKDGGVTPEQARKWKLLQDLKERNETLYFRLLMDNFVEAAPVVYTPTVGWACLNYHYVYRRPRGMFFSANDAGEMESMVHNWPGRHVDAIVVTDGSRILGLGDLGINGMGISIGKLDLYVAAAGFNPSRVMPCVLDVGTNNPDLQHNDLYMGLHHPRLEGEEYFEVVDEFVKAVMTRWPNAVLQFEDFALQAAGPLLERYRRYHAVFNDDIQGTAATALAGLYGAMKVKGLPESALKEQRIVVVGAGSAGMGVVSMIALGMEKQGATREEATSAFWINDAGGLITSARPDLADNVKPFARHTGQGDPEGEALLEVVKRVKPDIIIGLAGAGRLFTGQVLTEMGRANERPIIFPMSNPTTKMECTAVEAQFYTEGRAVFASGSPQADVETTDGRTIASSQANNMYIFPGLAWGVHLAEPGIVTDDMIMTAAETLPKLIPVEDLAAGKVYPRLEDIREISARVALEVMLTAEREGLLNNPKAVKELQDGEESLLRWIRKNMFFPKYTALVELPVGVNE